MLDEISLLALVKIGSRLVNDSMPKCRRFCVLSIKTLLSNVSEKSRNEAFSACIDWLNSEQVLIGKDLWGTKFKRGRPSFHQNPKSLKGGLRVFGRPRRKSKNILFLVVFLS